MKFGKRFKIDNNWKSKTCKSYPCITHVHILHMYHAYSQVRDHFWPLKSLFPVDTRRRFNVNTTSYDVVRRRIDVETTCCVYRVKMMENIFLFHFKSSFLISKFMTSQPEKQTIAIQILLKFQEVKAISQWNSVN